MVRHVEGLDPEHEKEAANKGPEEIDISVAVEEAIEKGELDEEKESKSKKKKPRVAKTLHHLGDLEAKLKDLKEALQSVLVPNLDKDVLEKRLREFFKEKKDKDSLKNLKSIVEEYATKQQELFNKLRKAYPETDLSWLTGDPELYKLSHGKTSKRAEGVKYPKDILKPTGFDGNLTEQQVQ